MGHATVEWVYVGVVVSLLTYVGAESWNVERLIEHAPVDAETIKVTGQQWFWTFEHEDGRQQEGEQMIRQLLLLLRRQHLQFLMVHQYKEILPMNLLHLQ